VRLHPYYTERSFARSPALAPIGELAGAHHERLDGGGYHRTTVAFGLSRAARILAAADSYQAMLEPRPHRAALDAASAEAEVLREATDGRLCAEAVDAVLAAAGHRVVKRPRDLPAGLTDRELEVLLALACGKTNREIAEELGISTKTAGHHVQHIFDKTGARTRTAATVWAFEQHLVPLAQA
jgi:DNA-binding CsgD family transcriptional regulator